MKELANTVLETCSSTNDIALQLGEAGYPQGTWVASKTQEKGRGRQGNEWISEEGNLFLSVIVRVKERRQWTWISLAAAIAVCEVLEEKLPWLKFQIKWPNDILLDGKKVCGILCESGGSAESRFFVIGIGLNCQSSPEISKRLTTSLSEVSKVSVDLESWRKWILESLAEIFLRLEKEGPTFLGDALEERLYFSRGAQIEWKEEGAKHQGEVIGLGAYGELLVLDPNGATRALYSGELNAYGFEDSESIL